MSTPSARRRRRFELKRRVTTLDLTPFRITLVYAAFAGLALFVSDVLFVRWIESPSVLRGFQTAKGGVEILLTGALIYALTSRSRRASEEKNELLRQSRAELSVLHRLFRHNLRNSINVIEGSARNLASESPRSADHADIERILRQSDRIVKHCDHASTIDDVTTNGERRYVTLDLARVLRSIASDVRGRHSDVDLSVDAPDAARVSANPELGAALREAIDNAVQYADDESPAVAVTVEAAESRTTVRVSDNGPGIPKIEREALSLGEETALTHGSGLGIWMMHWVVRQSDGELLFEADSVPGEHLAFVLRSASGPDRLDE